MRVADYIALRLQHWGVDTCFMVTGGGAMHLNDAFGAAPGIAVHYMHHEQSCAIAGEGFARVAGRPAVVNVTSGPGAINALNGVFGAYTDSIPLIVVAGQVRRNTIADLEGCTDLRQLGDQELRTAGMVAGITTFAAQIVDPATAPQVVDGAVLAAVSGRPGPVWIEVPVDVQGLDVPGLDPFATLPDLPRPVPVDADEVAAVLTELRTARRPVLMAGSGIRIAGVAAQFRQLAETLGVPVVTAWTHDTMPTNHELSVGRPGTIGTRGGNFVVQNCDRLVVLGSRLNIRQVSYNWDSFAGDAAITMVDIDPAEAAKPYLRIDHAVHADLRDFVPALLAAARSTASTPSRAGTSGDPVADGHTKAVADSHGEWVRWCREVADRFQPAPGDYPVRDSGINAYHFMMELFEVLDGSHVVVCGDATACIVPFQVGTIPDGLRMWSNSGSASMGYDLSAALGAAAADPDRRYIALAGDGSLMMNIQELQTLAASGADLLLIVLDNGGYLSIKQTQRNFFGREFGASPESGLTFPDFRRVAEAFALPVSEITIDSEWVLALHEAVKGSGPRVLVAKLDPEQEFEPRLKSKMTPHGIVTPPLDDMYPHLSDEVLAQVRNSAAKIC